MERTQKELNTKVLIMCGGKGTRMWPISNVGHPKQFEELLGKKSMFRQTVERVLKGFKADDIFVATSKSFVRHLRDQAPEIPEENFILEPAMRDNLGAIGLATAVINHRYPDSVMVILWGADHIVNNVTEFLSALKTAAGLAYEHRVIVHVDSRPTYPSVHNGWIKIGNLIKTVGKHEIYEFIQQVEKPNEETARQFFHSKLYLIHVGYMATRPELLLEYYKRYAPDAYSVIETIQPTIGTPRFLETLAREYQKFEKVAIDYGLFEKLPPKSQWEIPADMGWIDVGTWELLYYGMPKDQSGNVVIGKARLLDTKNSLIISKDIGIIGVIGLADMIVVDTEEGLLVCPLHEAPKVKQLYEELFE